MKLFGLLICFLAAIGSMEANGGFQRIKRGILDFPCPPPPMLRTIISGFVQKCKDVGIDIPPILTNIDNLPCPPTDELKSVMKMLISQAVQKGIPKPPDF